MWADLCEAVRYEIRHEWVFETNRTTGSIYLRKRGPLTPLDFGTLLYAALRAVHHKRGTKGTPVWWPEDDIFAFCIAHDPQRLSIDAWDALLEDSELGDIPAYLTRRGFYSVNSG